MTNQDLLLPFCKNVQTRQPQLDSDSFFEVKLGTLSKSFGARNDNFFKYEIYYSSELQPSLSLIYIFC